MQWQDSDDNYKDNDDNDNYTDNNNNNNNNEIDNVNVSIGCNQIQRVIRWGSSEVLVRKLVDDVEEKYILWIDIFEM